MEWPIQQVAKLAGTTSRTLRHYDDVGLLHPSRIGANGYRLYDATALMRLQRILLLRALGLGLPRIAEILASRASEEEALGEHLHLLRQEQERLARQIGSVQRTLDTLRRGGRIMAEEMFDGFDHTDYADEVTERWGAEAYARGDRWWRGMSAGEKDAWMQRSAQLARDWGAAAERGELPDGDVAQDLARRHVAWLRSVPGTPASTPDGDLRGYVLGLGEMYVADPRFARTYATSAGGTAGAAFVRDALRVHLDARDDAPAG